MIKKKWKGKKNASPAPFEVDPLSDIAPKRKKGNEPLEPPNDEPGAHGVSAIEEEKKIRQRSLAWHLLLAVRPPMLDMRNKLLPLLLLRLTIPRIHSQVALARFMPSALAKANKPPPTPSAPVPLMAILHLSNTMMPSPLGPKTPREAKHKPSP